MHVAAIVDDTIARFGGLFTLFRSINKEDAALDKKIKSICRGC